MTSTLEERVAYLEGKVSEQSQGFGEIRELQIQLSGRVDALDGKVDRFRDELSSRIDALDRKVDRFRVELSSRIDALDRKISRQFYWLAGMQFAVLLAVVGAMIRITQ